MIVIPLAALTSDISKSPVVGSIVDIPVVLLIVQIMAVLTENLADDLRCLLAAAVVASVRHRRAQNPGQGEHALDVFTYRPQIEHLVAADDWMTKFAIEHGWKSPNLSCDAISGWFNNGVINCLATITTPPCWISSCCWGIPSTKSPKARR